MDWPCVALVALQGAPVEAGKRSGLREALRVCMSVCGSWSGSVPQVEFVTYASLSACDEIVEVFEAVGASERVLRLLESPPAAQVITDTQRLHSTRISQLASLRFASL